MATKTVVTVISKISERPSAREACLVVIYGSELGKKHNVDRSILNLGRSSRADIQIDQESVSRNHARIVSTGKALLLRDLGSTNGTYVNDDLIDEHVLHDGDLVKIGRTILKFLSSGNIENAYYEEIYRLTTIDGLTQINNKRFFLESLDRELSRAKRYNRSLSLLMFDIDRFKSINDNYGHLAGDHVLKSLATLVKSKVRREDVFARYGGEEFTITLPENEAAGARAMAEKVRRLIGKARFKFEDIRIPVTVSVGGAVSGEDDLAESLIKRADEKLYEAKNAGRNCVRV